MAYVPFSNSQWNILTKTKLEYLPYLAVYLVETNRVLLEYYHRFLPHFTFVHIVLERGVPYQASERVKWELDYQGCRGGIMGGGGEGGEIRRLWVLSCEKLLKQAFLSS